MVKPQDREVSSVEDLVTKGQSTANPKVAIWRVPPTSRYRCTGSRRQLQSHLHSSLGVSADEQGGV